MANKKNAHHHGNLREALIDAGVELLRESGLEGLSIRKAAARAGVSHAAPAHHFATLADLRTTVVARGFRDFTAMMETEMALVDNAPRERLLAACKGYIVFAQQNKAMLELMFGGTEKTPDNEEMREASKAAHELLEAVCAPFAQDQARPEDAAVFVWSLVHGFASLMMANQIGFESGDKAFNQFKAILPEFKLPIGETR